MVNVPAVCGGGNEWHTPARATQMPCLVPSLSYAVSSSIGRLTPLDSIWCWLRENPVNAAESERKRLWRAVSVVGSTAVGELFAMLYIHLCDTNALPRVVVDVDW